jgi:hypothetical protein
MSCMIFAGILLIDQRNTAIDPTKLTKARQFQRTSAPSKNQDTSLWTETPAERQQRLADELSGKRRRAVNAEPDTEDDLDSRKRRRHEESVRKGVEEYTVCRLQKSSVYKLMPYFPYLYRKRIAVGLYSTSTVHGPQREVKMTRKVLLRFGTTLVTWRSPEG